MFKITRKMWTMHFCRLISIYIATWALSDIEPLTNKTLYRKKLSLIDRFDTIIFIFIPK